MSEYIIVIIAAVTLLALCIFWDKTTLKNIVLLTKSVDDYKKTTKVEIFKIIKFSIEHDIKNAHDNTGNRTNSLCILSPTTLYPIQ